MELVNVYEWKGKYLATMSTEGAMYVFRSGGFNVPVLMLPVAK